MYRYAMCKWIIQDEGFDFIYTLIDIANYLGVEIIDSEEHISGSTSVEGFRALNFVVKAPTEIYIEFYKEIYKYPGFRHWERVTKSEFTEAHFRFGTYPKGTLNETHGGLALDYLYVPDMRFNKTLTAYLASHPPSYYACEYVIRPIEFPEDDGNEEENIFDIYGSPIFDFVAIFNKRFPYCKPRAGQPYLNTDGWYVLPIVVRVFSTDEIEEIIPISNIEEHDWVSVSETYYFQAIKLVEYKYPPRVFRQFILSLQDKAQHNLRKQA
jgi:hypothetical protein